MAEGKIRTVTGYKIGNRVRRLVSGFEVRSAQYPEGEIIANPEPDWYTIRWTKGVPAGIPDVVVTAGSLDRWFEIVTEESDGKNDD